MIDEDADDALDSELPPNAQDAQRRDRQRLAQEEAAELAAALQQPVDDTPPDITPDILAAVRAIRDARHDGHPIVKPGSAAQRRAIQN